MFFTNDLIEHFSSGHFDLDFSHMELTQNSSQSPIIYSGMGNIKQNSDGRLAFKIYATSCTNIDDNSRFETGGLAGSLYEDQRYYTLKATDIYGREWSSIRIIPSVRAIGFNSSSRIAYGSLHSLHHERQSSLPTKFWTLNLQILADSQISPNASTDILTSVSNNTKTSSSKMDRAIFDCPFGTFDIHKDALGIHISISSKLAFQDNFTSRILESLCLVLSRELSWSSITSFGPGIEEIKLYDIRRYDTRGTQPPCVLEVYNDGSAWNLFRTYLGFIMNDTRIGYHDCSRYILMPLRLGNSTIESQSLALCVAIEGITRQFASQACNADQTNLTALESLRGYIQVWPDANELPSRSIRDRALGAISRLSSPSIPSILRHLHSAQIVSQRCAEAWSKLRNRLAHANNENVITTQSMVDLYNSTLVLLYQLVFHICQFQGTYIDYSTRGFPHQAYPTPHE
ncbi:MAG: hypothetical protein ACSLE1_01665 [Sphingobium sp.]